MRIQSNGLIVTVSMMSFTKVIDDNNRFAPDDSGANNIITSTYMFALPERRPKIFLRRL